VTNTSSTTPLLKEKRLEQIRNSIECIDKYAFNRNKQRDCVLKLYPHKEKSLEHRDKSIFRGMVLPSLRALGLITGRGQSIRVSANGKLIVESRNFDEEFQERVFRTVIYEIDKNVFKFLEHLSNFTSYKLGRFKDELCSKIEGPSEKQKRERISNWLFILKQVGLIFYDTRIAFIKASNFKQTLDDANARKIISLSFKKYFLAAYFKLAEESAGIVDILELREMVATKLLWGHKTILTENQFDENLRWIIPESDEYLISLGRPMGAGEKLFEYKGKYYKTILIRRHKREEK